MDAAAVLQTVQTVLSALQPGSTDLNISEVIAATNTTSLPSAEASNSFSPFLLVSRLLTVSAIRDWLKLLLVGGILEVCRRLLWRSWESIMNFFWITVTLDEGDDCGRERTNLFRRLTTRVQCRALQTGSCSGSQDTVCSVSTALPRSHHVGRS